MRRRAIEQGIEDKEEKEKMSNGAGERRTKGVED